MLINMYSSSLFVINTFNDYMPFFNYKAALGSPY